MSRTYPDLSFTVFPDQVQTFVNMLNITREDGSLVANFQKAMQDGDITTAQSYYNRIENADRKFLDANKLNELIDTCEAVERFYDSDIYSFVTNKENEWYEKASSFTYCGEYSVDKNYYVNNFVVYYSNLYLCIKDAPIGSDSYPTNTKYWIKLSFQGEQGESGTGASFRYQWANNVHYTEEDIVTYGNGIWCCRQPSFNNPPAIGSTEWEQILSSRLTSYAVTDVRPTSLSSGDLWFHISGE